MFRDALLCLALLLSAIVGEAEELVLPTVQPPPEHNSARFSDLIDIDVATVPTVIEEHGGRRPSNVRPGSSPLAPDSRTKTAASRPRRGSVAASTPSFSYPITLASFQGLGDNGASIPPDTTGAVGPQHVMVTLNTEVRIQTRSGAAISTKSLSTFWSPLGFFSNVFDPRVIYDPYAERWITAAVANANSNTSAILVAVSNTSDPTGTWTYYKFSGDPNSSGTKQYWADYTNLGFNKNWIVVSVNLIPFGSGTTNDARLLAISKADAYSGAANPFVAPFLVNNCNSMVPAFTYDPTLETMYIADEFDNTTGQLRIATITGPVGSEILSTGTAFVNSNSTWASFPLNSDFAPQMGNTHLISTGDSRLQNLIYRNGDLWASHTVFLPSGSTPTHSLVQWWQMSPDGTLKQFVRIEDPSAQTFYAYPGLTVNKDNFVLVGFSQFSSTIYPSASYSLQAAGTVNQMSTAPQIFKAGTGPYYKTFSLGENRWGDYSVAVVDPVDDTDFWTLQEYSATTTVPAYQFGVWWLHVFAGDGNVVAKPSSYDFGTRALQSIANQTFTLVNSTPNTVLINSINLAGSGASAYSETTNCPSALAAGSFCTITVQFSPPTAGAMPATLVIDNSGTPAQVGIALTGAGQDNGPPDSFPGLSLEWGNPAAVLTANLTADSEDPVPSCQGNLVGSNQSAITAWYQYVPDIDGSVTISATSTVDFAISVWTPSRRTVLYQQACHRAQFAGGLYTVSNATLSVGKTQGYYFMVSVPPGTTAPVTLNLPAAGSAASMSAIDSGLQFFPSSFVSNATQVAVVTNSTPTAQPLGISSGNPSFAISFVPGVQCSPTLAAGSSCIASITYTPAGAQPALPHATGTLSLSGNVTPPTANMQGFLPTGFSPYSAAYAITVDSLPFNDVRQVPVIAPSDNSTCFALKAPLFYTFTPTESGTAHVNLANYVVSVGGSDASSSCYSQFGAGTDAGFSVVAGVTYSLEIGTDARATVPASETVTLTANGSVFGLSPSPLFFGRFGFGDTSQPITMTLSNGSADPMPVTFSGSPFAVSNSTCGVTLAAASSCTFDLQMVAPAPQMGSVPYTAVFTAGNARSAVSWISPPMTLLSSVDSLQFSPVSVGQTSTAKSVVLVMKDNVGPVQVQTTAGFTQTNDCALATYARPYCTVNISFSPSATGVVNGALTVDYNLNPPPGSSSSTLNLSLTGSALPAAAVRPDRVIGRTSNTEVLHPALSRSAQSSAGSTRPPAKLGINKRTRKIKDLKTDRADGVN